MAFLDTVTSSSPIALRKCVPDTQNQIRKFELKKFLTVHVTQSLHVTKTSHVTSQRSPHRVSCKAQKAEASMVERLTPEVKRQQMEQDYQNYKKQFQEVEDISAPELRQLIEKKTDKVVLIDVRTPEERRVATIRPNVLTQEEFLDQKDSLKGQTIVTYCTAGLRSGKFAAKIHQEGFKVKNLKGSIIAWTQEGYPLVKGDGSGQSTQRVHAYGDHWAQQIGDGYEAETFSNSKGLFEGVRSVIPRWLGGSK